MSEREILEAIQVTAEAMGGAISPGALAIMTRDLLSEFDEATIYRSLERCRKELSGRLTQAAVRKFAQEADTRPGGDEAWSIALSGFDEATTIITNDEICAAMAVARPIIQAGDKIGARVAFRDAYERIVRESRAKGGGRPVWYPSLGHDPYGRVEAVKAAVARGLLTQQRADAYLPAPIDAGSEARGLAIAGLLTGKGGAMPNDPEFNARITKVIGVLKGRGA